MARTVIVGVSLLALCSAAATPPAAAQGRRFQNTIVVNPVVGNPVRSGNNLLLALTRAAGASATAPVLIRVEAGVYDVQGTPVAMLPFVDIEGSGRGVTTITGLVPAGAVVDGAADATLREVTVEQRGGGSVIRNLGDRFAMHRVTALGTAGASAGVVNGGASVDVSALTVRVAGASGGTGVLNTGADGAWHDIEVNLVGSGISYALFNFAGGEFTNVVAEAESSDAFAGGIRNEGAAASPTMRGVRAHARGTIAQAITNGGASSARLHDVVARAEATSSFAVGVSNQFGSPILQDADIRAVGVSTAYGVANLLGATVTMHGVSAVAVGGTLGAGLLSDASASVAHGSTFTGDFSVDLRADPGASARLGASQLDGPVNAGTGLLKCVASYDGAFDPLTPACTP